MTFFKKAMNYLGLGADDEFEDYDAPPPERERPVARRPTYVPDEPAGAVRAIPPRDRSWRPPPGERVVPRPSAPEEPADPRSSGSSSMRAVAIAANAKPHTVTPRRFDQAQEVADKYKEGQPVIVNLQALDRDLSRRLIDFASGLCYGLNGSMEKVAQGVYLLTPAGVSVSAEDRRPEPEGAAATP